MEVFIKVMNGLVITLGEDKRFYVFGCSIMGAILRFANGDANISIKSVLLHELPPCSILFLKFHNIVCHVYVKLLFAFETRLNFLC